MGVKAGLIAGMASAAAASLVSLASVQAGADARGFVCGVSNRSPATTAVKADGGRVPVIRWTSTTFDSAGWSQQRRCEEVSKRFDNFLKQGRLAYITTGRINGLPVICTAASKSGACDGLLYTLKPGQNATATLRDLLDIRVKARGPLNETSERLYVSLSELINAADANSKAEPVNTLW